MLDSKGVIFDMDGVLFPTEELKFEAYKKVFKDSYGVDIKETSERLGLAETKVMELFLTMHGKSSELPKIPELIQKKRRAYYDILAEQDFQPIVGVEEFLKGLKADGGFKIGLATVSNQESTDILMERFDFGKYFDSILSLEQVTKPKPDPEIYLLSAERLGVNPKNCVVFEDSPPGVAAAKAAGMKCVGITTGTTAGKLAAADVIIKNFKELHIEKIHGFFDSEA
jgi:HAD superfamily hydrolase (TIGR01509 family)